MARSSLVVILLFLISASAWAQVKNRYMVFFKDKAGSPYSISNPSAFLSAKAIERRTKQGIIVNDQDIPVNQSYVETVRSTGATVFFKTRWMNGVLVQCQPGLLPAIQALSIVDRVELVAPGEKLIGGGRKQVTLREKKTTAASATKAQLEMIGVDSMHNAGNLGEGISMAIFDGGFFGVNQTSPFQPLFSEGRIDGGVSFDFVSNTTNVFQYDDHGTQVFSVIAAVKNNVYTGGAYHATFQLYVTEDVNSEYRIEEYNWLFAAERADSAGVQIINSSLGYYDFDDASMNYIQSDMDGKTTVVSRAAQMAANRGIIVVCSAGNEGNKPWRIITAPADAQGVIAVANVTTQGVKSSSSSVGPSADNRIKPDLAALGSGVSVIRSDGSVGSASGTSLASPLIASLVAGVWQQYPDLSALAVIEALKNSASQASNPDNQLGYGIPNYKAVRNYLERTSQVEPFVVFPNPVDGKISIRPNDPTEIPVSRVEIFSTQGQLIGEYTVQFSWLNLTYEADLSLLTSGFYILNIWTGDRRFTYKLVKR
ncbi:MAG: S8 family peptidase [Cyclobacteriaceae bacterium]|nr:S8 family peptidase [Cyclobacteriaceae bacterium]